MWSWLRWRQAVLQILGQICSGGNLHSAESCCKVSRDQPPLLHTPSTSENSFIGINILCFWMPPFIQSHKLETLQQITSQYSPYSSFTLHSALKALFGLKPFVAPARRNLSLHCVFSTVFDHGRLSTVFYAVFTAGTFQQCILYFIFCSEFPAQAFVFRASILCQIIFHSPCSK